MRGLTNKANKASGQKGRFLFYYSQFYIEPEYNQKGNKLVRPREVQLEFVVSEKFIVIDDLYFLLLKKQ